MSSTCLFCPNSIEFHCGKCHESYCHTCGILKHLNEEMVSHNLDFICEECENCSTDIFCPHCEQYLCIACDQNIHKKAKRAQHIRQKCNPTFKLTNLESIIYLSITYFEENFVHGKVEQGLQKLDATYFGNENKERLYLTFPATKLTPLQANLIN